MRDAMEGEGASKDKNNEYSGMKGDRGRRGREALTIRSDELKRAGEERRGRREGAGKGKRGRV